MLKYADLLYIDNLLLGQLHVLFHIYWNVGNNAKNQNRLLYYVY